MYDLAKKARAGMKSKAERLAGEKDRKTDSSDWSPAEPLNADVKTGMRPVSRRAYKDGGKVADIAPKQRADRKARKAGGRVEEKKGEQPMVDRYVNRDLKKANEYRDGKKHVGALKDGGRAKKQAGGEMSADQHIREIIKSDAKNAAMDDFVKRKMFENKEGKIPLPPERPKNLNPPPKKVKPNWKYYITGDTITSAPKEIGKKNGGAAKHSDVKEDKALIKKMIKSSAMKGDRAKKADGGPMMMDPRLGMVKNKAMEFGQNTVVPGLKKGGRAEKASGGSAEFKQAFRAARNAFVKGEGPKNFEFKGKSYSTDLYKPTTGPATRGGTSGAPRKPVLVKKIDVQFGAPDSGMPKTDQISNPNPGMKKGGRIAKQIGGALGRAAGALGRGMPNAQQVMQRPGMGGGMNRPVPMGGKRPMPGMEQPMQMGAGFPGGPPIGSNPALNNIHQAYVGAERPMPMGGSQQIRQYAPFQEGFDPSKLRSTEGLNADQVAQIRASQPGGMNVPPPRGPNGEFMATTDQGLMSRMQPMPRKNGGRVARADGGMTMSKGDSKPKSKSGKTNINIIIATGGKKEPESMVPLPPPAPMGMPPMPAPAAAPAAPMGMPPMPPAAGMSPMDMMGKQPPAPGGFKRGGRISQVAKSYKDMEAGAGSGEGRLQKTDIAKRIPKPAFEKGLNLSDARGYPNKVLGATGGRTARKAGGTVYRSYKDMDAGSGSGKGRLEKTEIQSRKK